MFWHASDDLGSAGLQVWLATGHTDNTEMIPSLALQVQEVLKRDPLNESTAASLQQLRWCRGHPIHHVTLYRAVDSVEREMGSAVLTG
jgi:hypothetical protein